MPEEWRTEADDAWLATRRSNRFAKLRRMFGSMSGIADAVSQAELGPFGGAPRKPKLKNEDKDYSVVRPADHNVSHTIVSLVDPERCRRCGEPTEAYGVNRVDEEGERETVGVLRQCRHCGRDSWMLYSRMPRAERARLRGRKIVL
jgi:ribosomal protein L37E